ncbi:MAG: DNA gyrase subunit A [Armatimonadetes bacterium]|nr:DNA gyrase subunit A [Armatimonadota bacterium]
MPVAQQVIPVPIEDEMKESYLDYAMSVIVSRALPDVRDGLKPVHRRILFSMNSQHLTPDRPFKKSAGTVGEVIKSYHPHGDAAVYDAMVRLAQDFNMRYRLIQGHGNFGSVDGDPPAAYRYTEARLDPVAMQLLEDLDKETVDFRPNFDNSTAEPVILPARLPNLLINGSSGIAVGMATNIPPHNLGEVISAINLLIEDPEAPDDDLLRCVRAPDFPTGALIVGTYGARAAYLTGRGSVTMRGRAVVEEIRAHKQAIIVTEIPYQVNKARLIEQIADLVKDKRVTGITDLRDESDREGMRIVIELRSDAIPQVVLNQLYKHTPLQSNFGVNMLALIEGVPRILTLREILHAYLRHRREVVTRRTQYERRKAQERAHILEGLQICLDNLDEVIRIIRGASTPDEAKKSLVERFKLSEIQAQAILEMRLQRLTALERDKIAAEYKELIKLIAYLEEILGSPRRIDQLIREELEDLRKKYGDDRRSEIVEEVSSDLSVEDLIPEEDMVVTITHSGYIKRISETAYKSQKRGGRGVQGLSMKEEDFVNHLFVASTHDYLLFFTNKGRAYRVKVHEIPEAGRAAKGTAIVNLLPIPLTETINAVFPVKEFLENQYLFMVTRKGRLKKVPLKEFEHLRKTGVNAVTLEEEDELVRVRLTDGSEEIIVGTALGKCIRFPEKEVRPMGRTAKGVKSIRLRQGDWVVSMANLADKSELLTITSLGFGKRTPLELYRSQGRRGSGIKTMKVVPPRNGHVVSIRAVDADEELMVISKGGVLIRVRVGEISQQGRSTLGVRVIRLDEGDMVTTVALIEKKEEEENILEEG